MDSHYTHYLHSFVAFFVVAVVYLQACRERVIKEHFSGKGPKSKVKTRAEAQ